MVARLRFKPDRKVLKADGEDLSFVTIEVTDKRGIWQPNATNLLHFAIDGPAVIAGVDNGDVSNKESYEGDMRLAFHGRALVVIRTTQTAGKIKLIVRADGLVPGEVTIDAMPYKFRW